MKLLPASSKIDQINTKLQFSASTYSVKGWIAQYSCKMVSKEKALYKKLTTNTVFGVNDMKTLSPSPTVFSQMAAGYQAQSSGTDNPLEEKTSIKTLVHLICTLNAAFSPYYELEDVDSKEFSRESSLEWVQKAILKKFSGLAKEQFLEVEPDLWEAIDEEISLKDCEIYSFNPDQYSSPNSDESPLWSFYYFFYNPKLKRLIFFTCEAISVVNDEAEMSSDSMDFEDI